uniref:Protein EXECUTER 1, chloroplastic n=1 Tax=Triticum urartu TaxID=4572 RepID=A0A8R7JYZ3_TRIUA
MASVYTAPRAPLPATAASFPSSSSSSRQLDPNPSRFLAAHRGQRLLRVRRLAGAAPTRRASDVASVFRCGARSPGADPGGEPRRGWDALFHDALQGAVRRWSEYVRNYWPSAHPSKEAGLAKGAESSHELEERGQGVEEDGEEVDVVQEAGKWSWERWKQHFALIQESERLVDELQLQLRTAVCREDYRSAHKLKLAIAATSRNDTVGRAISELHRAIEEERYVDAAYIRDHAGAGLLGWWSGISGSLSDPYGLIIRISAEHGRYVAKSYDIRQLASDGHGYPIFEIYFAEANGGYNLQAVHLKPDVSDSDQLQNMLSGKLDVNNINISSSSLGAKHEEHDEGISMDDQNSDDSDVAAGPAGLKNLSNDSTPIPRIKILKVAPMENINQDYIIKIFDQISEEDDDNDEAEIENESSQDIGDEDNNEEAGTISAEENNDESAAEKAQQIPRKRVGFRTTEQDGDLKFDRLKLSGGNRKLPVLQLGIKQLNNKVQPKLYGVTHFSRIQMPISSDPLSGLYETASGFDSEVLSLQRKFGQWQEEDSSEEHLDLKFYEYVEAAKLTGDNLVPAGQVVFRAKVGKHYQLPHKGVIPRELGVVARYKGQRRIADAGFKNPRWVDGELLILDGKFIRDGPVIAFFYWTSNLHLFEFFRRLSLPD